MNKVTDSSVVAVMRRNAEKAKDYAERHGIPKWYADADELINDPEVNAVYIATPPNSHLELTKKLLRLESLCMLKSQWLEIMLSV